MGSRVTPDEHQGRSGTAAAGGVTARRVLVVDDDEDIGVLLASLFRRVGVTATVVTTGGAALRVLDELAPSLVVLDIGLPDVDGLEVLDQIRRTSDVPVLLLSARAFDTDRAAGGLRGADDFVTKPFHNAELVNRCLALLGRTLAPERSPRTGQDSPARSPRCAP